MKCIENKLVTWKDYEYHHQKTLPLTSWINASKLPIRLEDVAFGIILLMTLELPLFWLGNQECKCGCPQGVCHLCLHCELSGEFPEGGGPLTFIPTAPTQKHPEILHQCHPTAMRENNDPPLDSQCIFSANVLSLGPAVHRTSS